MRSISKPYGFRYHRPDAGHFLSLAAMFLFHPAFSGHKPDKLLGFAHLLAFVEGTIEGALHEEFIVWAAGDDLAPLEDKDERGVADGAETVRDDQHGLADDEFFER